VVAALLEARTLLCLLCKAYGSHSPLLHRFHGYKALPHPSLRSRAQRIPHKGDHNKERVRQHCTERVRKPGVSSYALVLDIRKYSPCGHTLTTIHSTKLDFNLSRRQKMCTNAQEPGDKSKGVLERVCMCNKTQACARECRRARSGVGQGTNSRRLQRKCTTITHCDVIR
jgi:hypothetical protein